LTFFLYCVLINKIIFLKYLYMNIQKTLFVLGTTLAILGTSSSVSANSDYICVKSVVDQPCIVTNWGPWRETSDPDVKIRTWRGTQVTEVSYYHLRTACEAWYTNEWVVGYGGGDSGRQGRADFPSKSKSCTITQKDVNKPKGNPNKNADPTKEYEVPLDTTKKR